MSLLPSLLLDDRLLLGSLTGEPLPRRLIFNNSHLSLFLVGITADTIFNPLPGTLRGMLMVTAGEAIAVAGTEYITLHEGDYFSLRTDQTWRFKTNTFADLLLFLVRGSQPATVRGSAN